MSFFYLLKENGYNWEKSRDIFYSLTEPQILLLNTMAAKEAQRIEDEARERESKVNRDAKFGGSQSHKQSFNLRG